MRFYVAVVIAAVVAWCVSAVWYMAFGKSWMVAQEGAPDAMVSARQAPPEPGALPPFVYAFVAELVMAWMLAGVLLHLGPRIPATIRSGMITGAFCWFGFVITTMLVSNRFARRDWRLLWIEGGHWLVVLLLMGAVLGAIGL